MARPTKEAAQASRTIGATPNFSAFGVGTGFDNWVSFLPELYGLNLLKDMFLMAETDETVGAMLYCIDTTMRQIDWYFAPQVDGKPAVDDAEAKKYADLMTGMLADMNRPFGEHLGDMLTMLWAGFAPCEMVTKRRDGVNSRYSDNFYGMAALNLLDQTSVFDWTYDLDTGEPIALRQLGYATSKGGEIPLSKVLLYRVNAQFNNPRGKPLLKNAWRSWKLKRRVQDSEAIGVERELCGLPVFEMPQDVLDQQYEKDAQGEPTLEAKKAIAMVEGAKRAVSEMRLNKSGGLVHPSDTFADEIDGDTTKRYAFRIQTTGGQRSIDSRTVVRDYDHAIARVAMMQFLTLGQRSGGSYGLSEDQSSMAVNSILALCTIVAGEWAAKAVPLLWQVNAWPAKYQPKLDHSPVNKNSLTTLGQFFAGLGRATDLWTGDGVMRESIARLTGLEYDHDAQSQGADAAQKAADLAAKPPPPPTFGAGGGAKPANTNQPTKTPAAANKTGVLEPEEE